MGLLCASPIANLLRTAKAEFDPSGQLIYAYSQFEPIHELTVPGKQIALLFLSIGPWISVYPVTDPWFKIDQPSNTSILFHDGAQEVRVKQYIRQPYTTVLACASSSKICHGTSDANRQCIDLLSTGSIAGPRTIAETLGLTERQWQIARRVRDAKSWSGFSEIALTSGGPGLLASQYMSYTSSYFEAPLPNSE